MSSCGKRHWTPVEVSLSVLCAALVVVCVSFLTIAWLALLPDSDQGQPEDTDTILRGRMVITEGAVFTEELKNKKSMQFKSLAFDTQQLISEAYFSSALNDKFKACQVLDFSKGSVVVNFGLQFHKSVEAKKAKLELVAGLQGVMGGTDGGLVIDSRTLQVTDVQTTAPSSTSTGTLITTSTPYTTSTTQDVCGPYHKACGDGFTCISTMQFCDGVNNCPDGSDENHSLCATTCDGKFLLLDPSGSFHSDNFPLPYSNGTICRWIIRVQKGLMIKIDFQSFHTEEEIDTLRLYEYTGQNKILMRMYTLLCGSTAR